MDATIETIPEPDIAIAAELFDILREKTSDGIGISRDSYGPGEQLAHDLLARTATSLGLQVAVDFAGNLYVTLPGKDRDAPRTIIGSHIDSVPCGGNFDGAAGVLGGLAILAGLKKRGITPRTSLTLMAIRAEETPWFPYSFIGSRAALGTLPPEVLSGVRRTDTGRTLAEHMTDFGFEPERVRNGEAFLTAANTARFFEIHIEQGPVLAERAVPVAVVSGIQGSTRRRQARIFGSYGHSGGVPKAYRRDAVAGFIDFSHAITSAWDKLEESGEQAVVTFCVVNTDPVHSSMNRIAGEVRFALDIRSLSQAVLADMDERIARAVLDAEKARDVVFDLGPHTATVPSLCDEASRSQLLASAERLGIPVIEMPSGGGHDAQAFIEAGIPSSMIFVRNTNGSHNPQEHMEISDLNAAARLLVHALMADGVI